MDTSTEPGGADRAPFVGRARELDFLEGLLRLRAGGPGGPPAVGVTGEPGIGKTRLLTEFALRARRRGATVLCGRAAGDAPHGTPFHAFADAVADLDPGDRAASPALAVLAELVEPPPAPGAADPDVLHEGPAHRGGMRHGGLMDAPAVMADPDVLHDGPAHRGGMRYGGPADAPAPGTAGAGDVRAVPPARVRRIAAALAQVPARGLVLVLDDFHHADPASVTLVDHLLRHPPRAPLLLVLAHRERQTGPTLASALARATDAGSLAPLALGPLPADDCAEGLVPGLPPGLAREIHATALGNPLYHRALAHARTHPGEAPGTGPVAMVLDELAPLGASERAVVEALAVLGGRAAAGLLAAVATSAPQTDGAAGADRALSELTRRDLVRSEDEGRVLVLRHPALPELVRDTLDPWRRRELHRRAADALARAGAPVTERAPHLVRTATTWDPAVAAALVEAAERIGAADPACAAHWLGAVLALLPDTPEHLPTRRELTLRRAEALGSAGRVAESRDLLHHLIDSCRPGPGGGTDTAELRTSAVLLCAFMERHLGRYPEADALLRGELERTPGPRPGLRTRLVVEWGCRALFAARYPEVRPVLAPTLAEARRRRDDTGAAEVLTLAALGEAYEGDIASSRVHAAEAAALTDAFTDGRLADHAESLVRLAWTEVFLEEYGTAERHATRGIAMARRAGRPFALSQLLLCSAYVHLVTGRVGTALDQAEESLAVARTLGGAELLGFSGAIRAVVLLHARPPGDSEALAAAEEAAATVGTADGWWATQTRCLLGYAVPIGADPHRVREVLVRAGGDPDLSRIQPSLRPGTSNSSRARPSPPGTSRRASGSPASPSPRPSRSACPSSSAPRGAPGARSSRAGANRRQRQRRSPRRRGTAPAAEPSCGRPTVCCSPRPAPGRRATGPGPPPSGAEAAGWPRRAAPACSSNWPTGADRCPRRPPPGDDSPSSPRASGRSRPWWPKGSPTRPWPTASV
ncbi:AAA family ATPase [Streptomyces sp. NPDC057193]|uniref:AAA family ATPase n=1 Tax=Streptomyces sp. NPDC057193 TaxID=3346043 RepID=UPI003637D979